MPTLFVPECREPVDCARLSYAKEWTQATGERTRRRYRKNFGNLGEGLESP
ncbi:MAG: hypothetical protein JNL74_05855 [Fibrobacteres bacterium]|nr:hypothetical protein [Fibrobacterota bacterium]